LLKKFRINVQIESNVRFNRDLKYVFSSRHGTYDEMLYLKSNIDQVLNLKSEIVRM